MTKDAKRLYDIEYRKRNFDKLNSLRIKWRNENPAKMNEYKKAFVSRHPSLVNWNAMMKRAFNNNYEYSKYYKGRGITVCNKWRDFPTFEHEFGYLKPGPQYSIDRINNDGNYEPGNVRWATAKQQAANRRSYATYRV